MLIARAYGLGPDSLSELAALGREPDRRPLFRSNNVVSVGAASERGPL